MSSTQGLGRDGQPAPSAAPRRPRTRIVSYSGCIASCGHATVTWINGAGVERLLDPRLDLRRHSPSGMAWGYGGSGPAQLSLAILAFHLNDDAAALRLYQGFKDLVVARLTPGQPFVLTPDEVNLALDELEGADPAAAAERVG